MAIKFEAHSAEEKELAHEYEIYKLLNAADENSDCEARGFPRAYYFGPFPTVAFHILITTYLPQEIDDLFENKCKKQFTRETIILIFIQTVKQQRLNIFR